MPLDSIVVVVEAAATIHNTDIYNAGFARNSVFAQELRNPIPTLGEE